MLKNKIHKVALSSTLLFTLFLATTSANGVVLGVVTGTNYKDMAADQQLTWFVGVLDGIMAESFSQFGTFLRAGMLSELPEFYKDNRGYDSWMGDCVGRYDIKQLQAVFEKRLYSQPQAWHAPAALFVRDAAASVCNPPSRPDIKGFPKP